jgi:hypothetical protein
MKTIKQKYDESLCDYAKHFCNTRNIILHIQDIKVIIAFRDGITDLKTVEEITMKKPKIMVDQLVVVDECFDASEACTWLLDSWGKGSKKKQEDREVNTTGRNDHDQSDLKFRRPFKYPIDAKKWYEIHHSIGHDLEECKI